MTEESLKTVNKPSQKGNTRSQNKSAANHRNATTTPEMREFIQTSKLPVAKLAKILNISEATVRKWRKRNSTHDSSNKPHKLNTTLTPMEEYVVVGLRYQLKMPLDKLLQATQKFINPNVSRSGLARCLKRYGVSRVDEIESPYFPEKYFNQLPISHGNQVQTYTVSPAQLAKTLSLPNQSGDSVVQVVSVTIPPKLTDEKPSSVLLGIDTQSDWIYLDIYQDSNTQATNRYIAYVLKHGPFHLRKLLVRNYHTFLQRFPGAVPKHDLQHSKPGTNNEMPVRLATSGDS